MTPRARGRRGGPKAQPAGTPVKGLRSALDTDRGMRIEDIKQRVERADYVVDPAVVAEAMLRRVVAYRRCWKPDSSWGTPPEQRLARGGPARTCPTQVSAGTAAAAAAASWSATQTHSS